MEFIWGPEQKEAWQLLEEELVRAPILAYPDPRKWFIPDIMPVDMASEQYCSRYRTEEIGSLHMAVVHFVK